MAISGPAPPLPGAKCPSRRSIRRETRMGTGLSDAVKRSPFIRVCHSASRSTSGWSSGCVRSVARAGVVARGSRCAMIAARAACLSHFRFAITNRTICSCIARGASANASCTRSSKPFTRTSTERLRVSTNSRTCRSPIDWSVRSRRSAERPASASSSASSGAVSIAAKASGDSVNPNPNWKSSAARTRKLIAQRPGRHAA